MKPIFLIALRGGESERKNRKRVKNHKIMNKKTGEKVISKEMKEYLSFFSPTQLQVV
jgi:hypothetical protein